MNLKAVGKDILKLNFGAAFSNAMALSPKVIDSSSYKGGSGYWFFQNGGNDAHFTYGSRNSAVKAYEQCPVIPAIINKKAQAYINGQTLILSTEGKDKGKESQTPFSKKLRVLISAPNPLQAWSQFESQAYIYKQLTGICVILPIKPVGFPSIDAKSLWILPTHMLEIREQRVINYYKPGLTIKDFIESIYFVFGGTRVPLNLDDLIIIRDFSPSMESLFLPESRICALEMPINNIIGAYESRNVLISYRGAMGIISSDKTDESGRVSLSITEKEDVQKDFLQYGLTSKQYKFIISNAQLKWQQMGIATKDLMLFEEIQDSTQRICDAYGYQYELLSSNTGVTFANKKEAKTLLYQDTIIPESKYDYEILSKAFGLDKEGLILSKDYSHIAALQEDKVNAGIARFNLNRALEIEWLNNIITWNQWQIELGKDPVDGKDVYFSQMVAEGTIFGAPSATANIPINNQTTNNGNQQQQPGSN